MNEKIDLTKILKDCPKGMELDCTMYDNVTLESVSNDINNNYPICIKTKSGFSTKLTKYGQNVCLNDAKCVIFPKGKTTWEGFVPPFNFKDGDIVYLDFGYYYKITIFKRQYREFLYYHASLMDNNILSINTGNSDIICTSYLKEIRFATEEEKQKLFDAIKANGYKWDSDTKTLDKLIVPKFKVGDTIQSKNDNNYKFTITNIDNNEFYHGCGKNGYGKMCEFMIPVVKQDNWELVIKPKFKIGDKIKHKIHTIKENIVTEIKDTHYILDDELALPFINQDNYELIPNKFDPKTLKPFDKVLVRTHPDNNWFATFFSHINYPATFCYKFATTSGLSYKYMIPYNEETKHLLGTNKQAPEFYIY